MKFTGNMSIRNDLLGVFRDPLDRTGGRGRSLPFILEQILKIVVAPLCRRRRPGQFDTARNGIGPVTAAVVARPAETLLLDRRSLGFQAFVRLRSGPVSLSKRVSARDQCNDLFIVHRHAIKGRSDVLSSGHVITACLRTLWIDVDQTHVSCGQRLVQLAISAKTFVVIQPARFVAPVNILIRFPNVTAPAAKAKCAKAHRFECDVAREDQQVGP